MSKLKTQEQDKAQDGVQNTFSVEILNYFDPDDKLYYTLSLSLDIAGAGKTPDEANSSFNAMLDDFIKYATDKGTITNELVRMGWDIRKEGKKTLAASSPTIEELKSNPDWSDIWAKKPIVGLRQIALTF